MSIAGLPGFRWKSPVDGLTKSWEAVAMIEFRSWPVADRQLASPILVLPPSLEKRSIMTLKSLLKFARLSVETETLPRNE